MEVENLESHLKYVNANGITLSIDERLNLELALSKLQLDFGFEQLLFWGKINGKFTPNSIKKEFMIHHYKTFLN